MRQLVLLALLLAPALAQAQGSRTFTGTITDSECADANHARMRMGDSDAECAKACVEMHDGTYLLFDGTVAYQLSDQKRAAALAGKKATVRGTLDEKAKTITVESIAAAN